MTALGKDARVSNRQIAASLGVTEGTIRTRIKRLQNEGLIQFTVVTDFKLAGSPNLVMLGIHADIGRVPALAKMLAGIPELGCVMVLLGRYNLLAMGLFTSIEQVNALIRTQFEHCRASARSKPPPQSVTSSTTHGWRASPGKKTA